MVSFFASRIRETIAINDMILFCFFLYLILFVTLFRLPGSSFGKESACNAGDLALVPESGRFAREGIGYSLQYSGVSLVTQLVKNLPEMRET